MDDLVQRLRSWAQNEEMVDVNYTAHGKDCNEGAARIEQLEAALRQIHDEPQGTWHGEEYDKCVPSKDYFISVVEWCRETARRALNGEDTDAVRS